MCLDCRILININRRNAFFFYAIMCVNQPKVGKSKTIPFNISASQNRSNNFGTFGVSCNQFIFFLSVYNESLIVACQNTPINIYIPVFERCSQSLNFPLDRLFDRRKNNPSSRIIKTIYIGILSNIIARYL